MPAERDPRVTDLRRYRRERARAERAAAQQKPTRNAAGQNEPILGKRPKAGVFLVLVVAVLVGLWFLGRH